MANRRPDDIVCFEVGSGEMPSWTSSRREIGDDLLALEVQARHGMIQIDASDDEIAIRGATRVGLAVLPSGRRLIVRSKISSLMLLEWLAYVGVFPQLTAWLPDAGVSVDDDWHQCIGRLFLKALENVTRRHMRKEYVPVAVDECGIRGRIVTTALARRLHRLPRVPQIQRRRTLDTPFNIVLALALDRLPLSLADGHGDELRRLARLREQWASVERHIDDPRSAVTAAQWASPPGYREALQLARLILIGAALDPASNMGGQAFSLPLAIVWECALRHMFDDLADPTGWRRLGDTQRTRRWDDPAGRDDPKRWLIADVIVERAGRRWVLDAKYKHGFGDEGRMDRFQMCAYALAFDAERASLVYPTAAAPVPHRGLLSVAVGGRTVQIDSIALPMAAGPEICLAALTSVVDRPLR